MSTNNSIVTVVVSTRKIDPDYLIHVKKSFSHPKTQILFYENDGSMSLPEVYNKGLEESVNDIVIFMHDDLIIETTNVTKKITKLFDGNPEFGIIGVAGTDNLLSGMWWQDRSSMYGVVGHIHEGKRHVNHYSKESYNEKLKEVVTVDGLFFAVCKSRIKNKFNIEFPGFHFYDIPFCVSNFVEGVKIGVTTKIKLTHKSIGMVDKKWEKNKLFFEALYGHLLPLRIG